MVRKTKISARRELEVTFRVYSDATSKHVRDTLAVKLADLGTVRNVEVKSPEKPRPEQFLGRNWDPRLGSAAAP